MFQQKRAYWRNLDNAAKLFSATSSLKDTRVFRFYCILKEEIDPELLQEALNGRSNDIRYSCLSCERGCSGITWKRAS